MSKNENKYKLLVLSDFDSRIKWGASLASYYATNCEITVLLKEAPHSLCSMYFHDYYTAIQYNNLNSALSNDYLFAFDFVIIALGGFEVVRVINAVRNGCATHKRRPILIAGFNGLVDPHDPHGLLCRYGADLILCKL
jgi:hypothetical protein